MSRNNRFTADFFKDELNSFGEDFAPSFELTVIAAGAIAAAGAVGAASISANASKKAGNAAQNAANAQIEAQQQAIQMQAPWAASGLQANKTLQEGLAPGGALNTPQYTALDPSKLKDDPGYQFALQQSMNSIANQRSAKGGGLGGNAINATLTQAQGIASQKYNDAFNQNLASWQAKLAQNQTTVGNLQMQSNAGQVASGAQSQLEAASGATAAAGIIGSANPYGGVNATNSAINTGGTIFGALNSPQGQSALSSLGKGLGSYFGNSASDNFESPGQAGGTTGVDTGDAGWTP